MTESRTKKGRPVAVEPPVVPDRDQADSERALGRLVSLGLPLVCVVSAIGVGFVAGVGSAILVVAAGALLGTIALLWASVRTLSGDAPLGERFEALAARRHGIDALGQEKQRLLRALKDLEAEKAIGKIDEGDYADVVAQYRADAKSVMRQMDVELEPRREEAERLTRAFLAKRLPGAANAEPAPASASEPSVDGRRPCPRCKTSNEPDAAFCKQCGAAMAERTDPDDARG